MPKSNTRKDPMLQKMVSPERRVEEVRLLKEAEASGWVGVNYKRVDYVPPDEIKDDEFDEENFKVEKEEGVIDLGDGNKWRTVEE